MYTILTECPLFRGMTADQIKEIIEPGQNCTITDYKEGDMIAHKDMAYSGLMILLKGDVRGQMTDPVGKILKVDTIEAPQLIAPAFLFGGYNRLPIDVIANTDVQILTLHRGLVFELMQENILILSNFIDIISNRANVWSKKIYLLSYNSLKAKIAHYLLDHTSEQAPTVEIPSITEIAEYFAATRNSLLTVLEGLEKKHILRLGKEHITVINREALRELLN